MAWIEPNLGIIFGFDDKKKVYNSGFYLFGNLIFVHRTSIHTVFLAIISKTPWTLAASICAEIHNQTNGRMSSRIFVFIFDSHERRDENDVWLIVISAI